MIRAIANQLAKQPEDIATRIVIAEVGWSGCQIIPMRLSIAQLMMVAPSQYLIAAGELQQVFFRSSIEPRLVMMPARG